MRLLSTREEEVGTLTEVGGAAALVQRYEPREPRGRLDVAFFCGPSPTNRPLFADCPPGATAVRALARRHGRGRPAGRGRREPPRRRERGPRPALARTRRWSCSPTCSTRCATFGLEEAVATADPAGLDARRRRARRAVRADARDRGHDAASRPTPVFGAQLAFNLLPRAADRDPAALGAAAASARADEPPISLQVVQGGVFHGLAASLHVRLAGTAANAEGRAQGPVPATPSSSSAKKPGHLGPIDAAASDKVLVGAVREDACRGGFWLWAVMDNLTRGGALNAVEVAEAVGG